MRPMTRIAAFGVLLAAAAHADVSWLRDFEKAKERALKEDKLVLIDFYADW
jgi:thiol:disulfide interchange protein